VLLAACIQPTTPTPVQPGAESAPLAGTSWTLTTLNGQPALAEVTVTLAFGKDGHISGSDGCNRYSAAYTADATNLTVVEPIVATMMACAEPIMQQATAYQTALGQAATYTLAGEQLTLADAGGQSIATFTAQSAALPGTSWEVVAYNNGKQAVVSVLGGTSLTASFGTDGTLSGSAGCNTYTAAYQSDGEQTLTIGPAASTRKMCTEPQGIMEQEAQYLAALTTAATYRVDGAQLEVRTADDALAVTLQRAAK